MFYIDSILLEKCAGVFFKLMIELSIGCMYDFDQSIGI